MKVLIIGNLGYVGSELMKYFSKKNITADGLDTGLFIPNLTCNIAPEIYLNKQIFLDVRNVNESNLIGYDAVIYLAAISNDPMGQKFKDQTMEINFKSAVEIAKKAKKIGLKNFIFASSCSVYGDSDNEIKTEKSSLNPLTTYAVSKVKAEESLEKLVNKSFKVTCLRFATACGTSDRLRLDLVVNDFVANSLINHSIKLLSKGNSFRPFISVRDMCRSIEWALKRKISEGGNFCTLNVGNKNLSMRIIDLARKVSDITQAKISISSEAQPDKRSYKVSYDKYYHLAKNYHPKDSLSLIVKDLVKNFNTNKFLTKDFRNSNYIRLQYLNQLITEKKLTKQLFWK